MKLVKTPPTVPAVVPDEPEHAWMDVKSPLAFGDVTLKSFSRVAEKVLEREVGKEDLTVPFADLSFVDELGAIDIRGYGRVLVTELAFAQLCARLKVPVDYMARCPLSLRNSNMSYWVEQNDERKVMLRLRKLPENQQSKDGIGILRAVLPQTYEPIDNTRILDWTAKAITEANGAMGIQSARISEMSTHLRLLFAKDYDLSADDDPDMFYFGVHVSDSEVGARGFTADVVSFRPAHATGFIHPTVDGNHLISQRHIHVDFKLLRKGFADSFAAAEENVENVREILIGAHDTTIRDPHSYIRRWVRHERMTNDFAETVIHAYEAEPKPSKFGIALALTRAAKRMPMDQRVDTEAVVGNYLAEGA
jgi:hypothetical protein